MKELFLGNFAGLSVVRDEDDLYVLVFGAEEAVEEKKERTRQIFFHGVHGAGGIHNAQDHRVRLSPDLADRMAIREIIFVERKAFGLKVARCPPLGRLLALHPGTGRSPLIQAYPDPLFAVTFAPILPLDLDLS